ncbi:MAG: NUDIX domain-containing protein [Pseudonocardia sp.]
MFALVPAAYVFLLRDGQVLLQLRSGTGFRDGHWAAGAAGHVELGESVFAAAAREAAEELGVRIDVADLEPLTVVHRRQPTGQPVDERVDFFFACRRWSGEPRLMESAKSAGLCWFGLDALPDPVVPHEKLVLDALCDGAARRLATFGF